MSQDRTLTVIGASGSGKKTLMGSLVYKCGLDLVKLETLTKQGINKFDQIPNFLKRIGQDVSFETRSGKWTVASTELAAQSCQTAICVLDVLQDDSPFTASTLLEELSHGASPHAKVIVAVNKMDKVEWSRERFLELVNATREAFNKTDGILSQARFIPISATSGDNILDLSSNSAWYREEDKSGLTLIDALDA